MISLTCGSAGTWTKWSWFSGLFAAGVTNSTSSTVTLQYCPNDWYSRPTSSSDTVAVYTWSGAGVQNVTPPTPGGWYRIGIDTGDYTDDADVFMAG